MNSDLYFCQLSDLIISKQANTVLTDEGNIRNLLPEEALIQKTSLLKPLPWKEYSDQEIKYYLKDLNKNKWISLSYIGTEVFVQVQQKYRLKILNNLFNRESNKWKEVKYEDSAIHVINSGKSLSLKSVSSNETYLSIPNIFSNLSREISFPNNFSLLIDPYFQDIYFRSVLLWIESMTNESNNIQPSSIQVNDCLEFLKAVLHDVGDNVVTISNDVDIIKLNSQSFLDKKKRTFTLEVNYKNGLSIQLFYKQDQLLPTHIYNLDLNPIALLNDPIKWTNILQSLIQMYMYDINLQIRLNAE